MVYNNSKFSFFIMNHKIDLNGSKIQTHIIGFHAYAVRHPVTRLVVGLPFATCPTSIIQWYCGNTRSALVSRLIMHTTFAVAYVPAI